jgi:hypothetical protein
MKTYKQVSEDTYVLTTDIGGGEQADMCIPKNLCNKDYRNMLQEVESHTAEIISLSD